MNDLVVFTAHTQHIVLRVAAALADQIAARLAKCEKQIGGVRPADRAVKVALTSRLLVIQRILQDEHGAVQLIPIILSSLNTLYILII